MNNLRTPPPDAHKGRHYISKNLPVLSSEGKWQAKGGATRNAHTGRLLQGRGQRGEARKAPARGPAPLPAAPASTYHQHFAKKPTCVSTRNVGTGDGWVDRRRPYTCPVSRLVFLATLLLTLLLSSCAFPGMVST